MIDLNGRYVFYILGPEHCRAIQMRLFELGVEWADGRKVVQHTDAHRLFLYGGKMPSICYIRDANYTHDRSMVVTGLEDLYDEPPTQSVMMPETQYSKWNKVCFAKLLLKNWAFTGLASNALACMEEEKTIHPEKRLCDYITRYQFERPADLPPDILAELLRRAGIEGRT